MAAPISGIYTITNIASGKRYYGSSVNVWGRQRQHWHSLRKGAHKNPHLQAAWNKYGEVAFVFALVERVSPSGLVAAEQRYLDENRNGYNLSKCAECAPRGLKWSEESRKRMSEARKGMRLSESHKVSLSRALTGRKLTAAQREAISQRMSGQAVGEEIKEKIGDSLRLKWRDGAYRKRMTASQTAGKRTAQAKANYSAASKKMWDDADFKAQMSAKIKARWADPEYRRRMLEVRKVQGKKLRERNSTTKGN